MRWEGARSTHERVKNAYKFWSESQNGRDLLEDLGVDKNIILE